jgi:hypothetical protein
MDRELQNIMRKVQGKSGNLAALQEVSMKHIALIQTYAVDLPSWHAAYIKSMKDYGDEQRAYQYADWVVENVQGSGLTKDMAALYRNQSESMRILTMFMTYFSALWNMERDMVKGFRSERYSTTDIAAKALFLFAVPVVFEMLLRGDFGDDDDAATIAEKIAVKTAIFPIQSVPFIRDIVNAKVTGFSYAMSPVASMIEKGLASSQTAILTDEEIKMRDVKNTSKIVGALLGVPGTGQAWLTGEHLYDVLVNGEELTFRQLLIGHVKK